MSNEKSFPYKLSQILNSNPPPALSHFLFLSLIRFASKFHIGNGQMAKLKTKSEGKMKRHTSDTMSHKLVSHI